MALPSQRSFSFIVRIWRESGECETEACHWRGSIEEVESGDRVYYADVTAMLGFLKGRVASIGINLDVSGAREGTDVA